MQFYEVVLVKITKTRFGMKLWSRHEDRSSLFSRNKSKKLFKIRIADIDRIHYNRHITK